MSEIPKSTEMFKAVRRNKRRPHGPVNIDMGSTLSRKHADMLSKTLSIKQEEKLPNTPNEYSATSATPKTIEHPYSLYALERVIRESPELSRVIQAIVIGVGSRGFQIDCKEAESNTEAEREKEDLEAFFKHLCPNRSFSQAMKLLVASRKKYGFGAWEVLRNAGGQISGVNPIEDCKTLNLCEMDDQWIPVEQTINIGKERTHTITRPYRYRRFVQRVRLTRAVRGLDMYGKPIYFKEFGDKRHLNKVTGEYWTGKSEPPLNFERATEILLFPVVDTGGEHPIPEWIPILPDALASYAIRVCNLDVLDNSAVPPMAVIIEGTDNPMIYQQAIDQLEEIKGRTSRSKALILQTPAVKVGSGTNSDNMLPKIRVEPLSPLMSTEGMFLKYLEWLARSIAAIMRVPLLLTGEVTSALNSRATADAIMSFADDQVFRPEAQDIEDVINGRFIPELVTFSNQLNGQKGVKYSTFKLGTYTADEVAEMLEAMKAGDTALSVNEKRQVLNQVLSIDIDPIESEDADLPVGLAKDDSKDSPKDDSVTELPDGTLTNALKSAAEKAYGIKVDRVFLYEPNYSDTL